MFNIPSVAHIGHRTQRMHSEYLLFNLQIEFCWSQRNGKIKQIFKKAKL